MFNTDKLSLDQIFKGLLSLTIYRGVLERPVTSQLVNTLRNCIHNDEEAAFSDWGALFSLILKNSEQKSLTAAIASEVLSDQNIFTLKLAGKQNIPQDIMELAQRDLSILYHASSFAADVIPERLNHAKDGILPRWADSPFGYPFVRQWNDCINELCEYHYKNGVGRYTLHKAFLWHKDSIRPVLHPDPIRLYDLKSYETQRNIAIDNTLAFLDGYESNNMLLYGDRGTGKSSTVKALLNEYADRGLRMIEMPKETLSNLSELTSQLAPIPMKFIIFIDDLSFSGNDDYFAALKAVLEGGLASKPDNVLIYATSNRRHLVRETSSARNTDEIHRADTIQEAVSLSDRFGIFLTFLMPDKQHFLDIVEQMASDRNITIDRQALLHAAEQWALERGARSPRYARQFITDLQARLSRSKSL